MSERSRAPVRRVGVISILGLVVALSFTGCWKKSGDAIVIGKDYVPARTVEAPNESTPAPSPVSADAKEAASEETAVHETNGTPANSRTTTEEQWIVQVEMVDDRRKIDVRVDAPQWNALKENDRVRVIYWQGKYTGTVWSAEIKERLPSR